MIRSIFIILMFFSNLSQAIDSPNTHQLYNEGADKSYITVKCSALKNDGSIICDFSQSTFRYKLNPEKFESKIKETTIWLESDEFKNLAVAEIKVGMCKDYLANIKSNKAALNELKKGYMKDFKTKLFGLFDKMCESDGKEFIKYSFLELANLTTKKDTLTCGISSHSWTETFQPKSNSNGDYWLAQSAGNDECGIINISTLKKDGDYFWKYNSKRVITNKEGEGILPCNKLEERNVTYSWQQKEYDISCKVFTFGI